VFIAGAGGLGSPVCEYLAVCGVGTLRVCDSGEPELSNLNRQILHDESRINMNKALSAQQTLKRLNPHVNVIALPEHIADENIAELAGNASLIIDCLDNFEARHVLNRYAVKRGIPLVHGAIHGLNGQVSVFHTPRTPCLACIFPPEIPREIFPVAGFTAGVIGSLQATETIKLLLGLGTPLYGSLLMWDGALADFQKITICKSPACTVCGEQT
jgi:adenylyltransferase/sulfurtransferase